MKELLINEAERLVSVASSYDSIKCISTGHKQQQRKMGKFTGRSYLGNWVSVCVYYLSATNLLLQ